MKALPTDPAEHLFAAHFLAQGDSLVFADAALMALEAPPSEARNRAMEKLVEAQALVLRLHSIPTPAALAHARYQAELALK